MKAITNVCFKWFPWFFSIYKYIKTSTNLFFWILMQTFSY